jgi:hypothetical protein
MPPSAPDLLQAVGAVAAGSGEHDGDGPFAPVGGQRTKQHIDRMAMAPRFRRLGHVQPAVPNFQFGIGSDHIDVVGRNWRPIRDLCHRHRRAAGQNVRHLAFAPRIEMQHDHERATAVGGHGIEKVAECLDAAGRRADADDGGGLPRQATAMGGRAGPC